MPDYLLSLCCSSAVWNSSIYTLIAGIFLVFLFTGLYFIKKDSANGRLLIWQCSWEMIKDKPLSGHGHDGFKAEYMNYQANYFEEYPESKHIMLADNITRPFNEYIGLLINYGLIGFLVFLLFLFYLSRAYSQNKNKTLLTHIAGWCLIAIAVFAFFSYPLRYPFVWITGLLSCLVILFQYKNPCKSMLSEYQLLYPKLKNYELFLYNYASELNFTKHYEESLAIARECERLWADYDLQMLMADNYQKLEKYTEAERHYRKAAAMCPV